MPPHVDVCRCGIAREAVVADTFAAEEPCAPGGVPSWAWLVPLVLTAVVGAWLWSGVRTPPAPLSPAAPDTLPASVSRRGPTPAPPAHAAAPASDTKPLEWSPDTEEIFARTPAPAPASSNLLPPAAGIGVEDLVARAMGAVVMVESPAGRGTGFFVRPDVLVTNDHVVGTATSVTLRLYDGSTRTARVERTVPDVDLAVLRTALPAVAPTVLPLGRLETIRPGQEVIAIGSALGLQNTVTRGIVSARRQSGSVVLLQTDAAINPGNSGGPLLNRDGEVLGVTTMKIGGSAEGIGFAVAADHVRALIEGQSSTAIATAAGPAPQAPPDGTALGGFGSARSSADAQREAGQQTYDRNLAAAVTQAAEIDGYWNRFRASCAPRQAQGGDREWFALADAAVDYSGNNRNCPYWLADLQTMSRAFVAAMRQAHDAARRAGVYPGAMRDARRRQRLDWAGFDR